MNKNLLYVLIILSLGAIAYFTVFKDEFGSYSKKETAFAVEDTSDISLIRLSNLKGDTITLSHTANVWTVNQLYKARPDAISNLLRALAQLEVKVPVAKSMHNNVISNISGRRIKVEIYDSKQEKFKGFYIGDNTDELNGTFMLMEESDHAFVVNVPGFEGFAATVFFVNETEWRSREIFSYIPENISQIDIQYTGKIDSSFSIVRKTDQSLELITTKQTAVQANPEILNYYLKQFKLLNAESFILEPYKKDSLLGTQPVCEITITDTQHQSKTLKVFYRPVTDRTKLQFTYDNKPVNFDLDRFYGIYNNNQDLAIIQNFVFGKLFVGPEYFYRKRPSNGNVLIDEYMKKAASH